MSTSKEQMVQVATASKIGRVWERPNVDEVRVYDGSDYLVLVPTTSILNGVESDAIAVSGRLSRRNGAAYAALRAAGESLGIYTRA